jgi:hypothetical protein
MVLIAKAAIVISTVTKDIPSASERPVISALPPLGGF